MDTFTLLMIAIFLCLSGSFLARIGGILSAEGHARSADGALWMAGASIVSGVLLAVGTVTVAALS